MALLQNVIAKGTHAARPAAGSAGVLYYETDVYKLFRDSGSAWDEIDLTAAVITQGQLTQARGGTGIDSSAVTNGQLLIGKTSDNSLNLATLTAGSGVTITNGAGSVTVAATGSSGALTELADNVVSGSSTTTVSFTSISGSYTSLLLSVTARCDEATTDDYAKLQFNADTGSNYEANLAEGQANSFSGARTTAQTSINRILDVPGSTAAANMPTGAQIWIPHYVDTTFNKVAISLGGFNYGTNLPSAYTAAGIWKSTAAITQIDLIAPASSHWIAGSHFRLFGQN